MASKTVTRVLADGTVKSYSYPRKPKAAKVAQAPKVTTVRMVVDQYRASSRYKKLKPNSVRVYDRAIGHVLEDFGNAPIESIRRRHVEGHRDDFLETASLANQVHMVWGVLLKFAADMETIPFHPALGIDRLDTGEHARWAEEAIAYAMEWFPEHLRRAVVLGLYTGQREGDCIRMTWRDIKDGLIRVVQEKTGEKVWIPCHADLAAEIEVWRRTTTSIALLTSATKVPWTKSASFATVMGREIKGHRDLAGLVFHGLRKSAAATLAEAGCDVFEISAITGHTNLKTLQLYVREAQRKRLAQSAMTKWEAHRPAK